MKAGSPALSPQCPECGQLRRRTGTTIVNGRPQPLYAAPCDAPCVVPKESDAEKLLGCGCLIALLLAVVAVILVSLWAILALRHGSARTEGFACLVPLFRGS